MKHSHSAGSRIEHLFETLVFASRWIQAPLYGGLIVAELLYAYKFLVELWEAVVFASRWIQAPLYGGLIVAELLYAYKFLVELWEMVVHIQGLEETKFMLGVLGLIDVTMVANLLTMVIIGGYATFVSKLSLEGHPDRPDWLTHIDPG